MNQSLQPMRQHPVRSLLPPLEVLQTLGIDQRQCLDKTGISIDGINDANATMSLHQELQFYRNVQALTSDPCIGLKIGRAFLPVQYGLFGYALLSAESFRHALAILENYGSLTFSFFKYQYREEGLRTHLQISDPPPIDEDLLNLYLDRDLSAAYVGLCTILDSEIPLYQVSLPHDGNGRSQDYRHHFSCEALFDQPVGSFSFSSEILEQPLPQSDPESSRHLQQQCQLLVAKLSRRGRFVDEVRLMILAQPGYFPDIEFLAERLGMSTRTFRRRLSEEGSSYRLLLEEIRFGLAKEYLLNTALPMEEVSRLLGYGELANFSHAFKRWSGVSPSRWRKVSQATH